MTVTSKPKASSITPGVFQAGRVALVTGGASGIGLGLATAMLECGMCVAIGDVRKDHLATASAALAHHSERLLTLELDVSRRQDWERAADAVARRFGPLHFLGLNAGVGVMGTILGSKMGDWRWLMEVNLAGVTNGLEAFLPQLRAHGEPAHILATSSMGGLTVAAQGGIYSCAKFGVSALMESLHAEFAGSAVGVSLLCPAAVNTNIFDHDEMRPVRHGDTGYVLPPAIAAEIRDISRQILSRGADPLTFGRQVIAAITRGDFYIFTDGAVQPVLELRRDALISTARAMKVMA